MSSEGIWQENRHQEVTPYIGIASYQHMLRRALARRWHKHHGIWRIMAMA